VETDYESLGVDTPADLDRVNSLIEAMRKACYTGDCKAGDTEPIPAGADRG
jgi:hypothetical protein